MSSLVFAEEAVIIDVRSASEFNDRHVEGALNIEFQSIVDGAEQRGIDPDTSIYVYCGSGKRAGMALDSLRAAGYWPVGETTSTPSSRTRVPSS